MDDLHAFEQQLEREVRHVFGPPRPVDVVSIVRTAAESAEAHPGSRWWPFPVRHRTPKAPMATDATDYQPSPIPATNGHTPTVIGRTKTMFSPAKAIAAGALVFAVGSVLFVAQPFDQQGDQAPAAESGDVAAAWVTGNFVHAAMCTPPTTEVAGEVTHERGYECQPERWRTSDPRLSGEVVARWNADVFNLDEGVKSVITRIHLVQNEGGEWTCRSDVLADGSSYAHDPVADETVSCVGDGGYEGLSAILVLDRVSGDASLDGLVFSGSAPPLPERPAT